MGDVMSFPDTFEEFAEQYKIVDKQQIYTNGTEMIPIFRVKQWLYERPTADVVPRAEVEKLSIELLHAKEDYGDLFATLIRAKAEVASEVITELQRMWNVRALAGHKCGLEVYIISKRDYCSLIDGLKKEYTERESGAE